MTEGHFWIRSRESAAWTVVFVWSSASGFWVSAYGTYEDSPISEYDSAKWEWGPRIAEPSTFTGVDLATGPDITVQTTMDRQGNVVEQLTLTSPLPPPLEPTPFEQRDEVMEALTRYRAKIVQLGRAAADELVAQHGRVTAPMVFDLLRERGHGPLLDSTDPRVAGAWFRGAKWTRVELVNTGSKGRAVSVWGLRP